MEKQTSAISASCPPIIRHMVESGNMARLMPSAITVLVVIKTAIDTGQRSPSIAKIAKQSGLSASQVMSSIESLEAAGYLRHSFAVVAEPS